MGPDGHGCLSSLALENLEGNVTPRAVEEAAVAGVSDSLTRNVTGRKSKTASQTRPVLIPRVGGCEERPPSGLCDAQLALTQSDNRKGPDLPTWNLHGSRWQGSGTSAVGGPDAPLQAGKVTRATGNGMRATEQEGLLGDSQRGGETRPQGQGADSCRKPG